MKAHLRIGRLTIEAQGETIKDLFRELATADEVFAAESECGICGSPDIGMQVRTVDSYQFYELKCKSQDCGAKFAFGQSKNGGGLFPKRKDEDGNWLPHGGWSKWEG